jgi:integrase
MTFEEAFNSYMTVSGTERSAAYQDKLMFKFFRRQFGINCPIADISPRIISRCLAVLRGKLITRKGQRLPLSPATINRHTQFLRRVFNHAVDLNEPVQQIRWKAFIVVEPEARIYPLTKEEELCVLANIDPSIKPLFAFSMLTGVRLRNAIGLRWSMINKETNEISFRGKSRRPGGKTYIIPITSAVQKLLSSCRGHHDEFVFTFVASRAHGGRKAGHRYPIKLGVVRYYWEKLNLGKRWHDVRHTFGTRLYGVSKDIHLVQRAMNHSNVQTTLRYVHANHEDVREAMEKLPTAFISLNEPSADRHDLFSSKKNKNIVNLKDYQIGAVERTRTSTPFGASTSS